MYHDIFDTLDQTTELEAAKVTTPILAIGGEFSQGTDIAKDLRRVVTDVEGHALAGTLHFLLDEKPDSVVRQLNAFVAVVE